MSHEFFCWLELLKYTAQEAGVICGAPRETTPGIFENDPGTCQHQSSHQNTSLGNSLLFNQPTKQNLKLSLFKKKTQQKNGLDTSRKCSNVTQKGTIFFFSNHPVSGDMSVFRGSIC